MTSLLIRDLYKVLGRPIKAEWVKSHQDDGTPYTSLSADAKLNVDADHLTTQFHKWPRAKPMRGTEHIPSTMILIQILSTHYDGNLNDNIHHHINSGYMKAYLQGQHKCSKKVWATVDTLHYTVPCIH